MDIKAEALAQHRWLQRMVGNWTYESTCDAGADQPPMRNKGRESMRALGDLWIIGEGEGEMGGGAAHTRITLGYDPQKARFVGSWVGSMMAYQWVYEGNLDEAQKVLTLDCIGPSFTGDGTLAKYQDIITMENDDHRILTSRAEGSDGKWKQFLEAHYRRAK